MHASPDAPLVDLRWFVTDLPFLEGESLLNSRNLDSEPEQPRLIGEVADWEAERTYNGHWTAPNGLLGGHVCHPEWFASGEPWPVTLPAQQYDPQGIPLCCCVAAYDIHADRVWHCLPVALHPCEQWFHLEPGPGNDWIIAVPGFASVAAWRVRRTGPAVGQIAEFRLAPELWNGRGVSPPMPFFAGTPIPGVPEVTVWEVTP